MTYACSALRNVQSMTVGHEKDEHWNLLWHWIKHAQPLIVRGNLRRSADLTGIDSEAAYLNVARHICSAAARGALGTAVKVRERHREGGQFWDEWLIWYDPPGGVKGIFVALKVVGTRGEVKTMFAPDNGRSYYDDQDGIMVQ